MKKILYLFIALITITACKTTQSNNKIVNKERIEQNNRTIDSLQKTIDTKIAKLNEYGTAQPAKYGSINDKAQMVKKSSEELISLVDAMISTQQQKKQVNDKDIEKLIKCMNKIKNEAEILNNYPEITHHIKTSFDIDYLEDKEGVKVMLPEFIKGNPNSINLLHELKVNAVKYQYVTVNSFIL